MAETHGRTGDPTGSQEASQLRPSPEGESGQAKPAAELDGHPAPMPQAEPQRLSTAQWLVLAAAFLGWMFDGVEIGLFPLVARPALQELLADLGDAAVGSWNGVIVACFLLGAATGGLVFGWLGDKIGRVRAMVLSILTYSLFTGAGFFATQAWHLGLLRFIASLGMGGEWAVAVALVVECWPEKHRPKLAGAIGAAANFGFLFIGIVASVFPVQPGSWRWMMLVGAAPAVLALLVTFFVPESERWRAAVKAEHGRAGPASNDRGSAATLRPLMMGAVLIGSLGCFVVFVLHSLLQSEQPASLEAFFAVLPSAIAARPWLFAILGVLLFSLMPLLVLSRAGWRAGYLGITFSAIPLIGTWAAVSGWIPLWVEQMSQAQLVEKALPESQLTKIPTSQLKAKLAEVKPRLSQTQWSEIDRSAARTKANVQVILAIGAIIGCFIAPMLGGVWGRRPVYFWLCLLSLATCWWLFRLLTLSDGWQFWLAAWIAGGVTAAFYGWLPLYLPEIFPTSVRATGQGLSFNFGRILAAAAAIQMGDLVRFLGGDYARAGSQIALIYVAGLVLIWLSPETKGRPLPD